MKKEELIIEAEGKIAAILKQLEINMDMLLEGIDVQDIDITQMSDSRIQLQRRVVISMRRTPGSNWD